MTTAKTNIWSKSSSKLTRNEIIADIIATKMKIWQFYAVFLDDLK